MAIGEMNAKFIGGMQQLEFTAKAAFVSSRTGDTHGWTNAGTSVWSPETIEKLKELRALMEIDLGRLHLEGGGEALIGPSSTATSVSKGSEGPGGIGEHIGGGQV
jgi:hypothetical protein